MLAAAAAAAAAAEEDDDGIVWHAPGEGAVASEVRAAAYRRLATYTGGYSLADEEAVRQQRARVRELASRLNAVVGPPKLFDTEPLSSFEDTAERARFAALTSVEAVRHTFDVYTQRRYERPHATLAHWCSLMRRVGLDVEKMRKQRIRPTVVPSAHACAHTGAEILVLAFEFDLESSDARVRLRFVFHVVSENDASDDDARSSVLCLRAYQFCPNSLAG